MPCVLEGAHQQHRVLVVVGEYGIQPQVRPGRGQLGRRVLGEGEVEGAYDGVGMGRGGGAYSGQAGVGEAGQARFGGPDHADAAAAAGEQMGARGPARLVLVQEEGVGAGGGGRAVGEHRGRAGAAEQGDGGGVRRRGVEGQDGCGAQFGPGAGGGQGSGGGRAVQDDGVPQAVQRGLEAGQEGREERTEGGGRIGGSGQQNDAAAARPQTPRRGMRDVSQLLGGGPHLRLCALPDPPGGLPVQDVGHGRTGHPGAAGNGRTGRGCWGGPGAGGVSHAAGHPRTGVCARGVAARDVQKLPLHV